MQICVKNCAIDLKKNNLYNCKPWFKYVFEFKSMNDCYHNTLVRFLFCLISFGLVLPPPLRDADAGAVATVFVK